MKKSFTLSDFGKGNLIKGEIFMDLLTTRTFNGVALDCYKCDDNSDFWATREQVGRLLGYKNPRKAIKDIHLRNQERLDKFSKQVELRTQFNGAQNEPPFRNEPVATVYNFKGLLEICRYSNQPAANAVIDFLWDVADDIRKHGMYISDKLREAAKVDPEAFNAVVKKYLAEKEKTHALEDYIEANRAFTNVGHLVLALKGSIPVADMAQLCAQHGYDIGRNRLYQIYRDLGLASKQKNRKNKPTQKGIEKGLVNLQVGADGNLTLTTQTMVTPKGIDQTLKIIQAIQRPLEALWEAAEKDEEKKK